ncbi:MAG: 4Fe-4S binding protein [Firmicutes bacterium]|nr:4Fe-4S binding protein [Bacillota bacterium]
MRKKRAQDINERSTWQELTIGAEIYEPATSKLVNTGEWRVNRPVFDKEKCKNCMMCFLYCPDSSVVVKEECVQGFDYMHCKGCGICAKVCPFGAIDMVKEG